MISGSALLGEIPQGGSQEDSPKTVAILSHVTPPKPRGRLLILQNPNHDKLGEPGSLLAGF